MKVTGIVLLSIGIISILIQNTFYGYMDTEGVIHDSVFLPLGALATLAGALFLAFCGIRYLYKKMCTSKHAVSKI